MPVEAVVVVAHGGEERHDETTVAPDLAHVVAEVGVLPADAEVLLVHADRIRQLDRLTVLIVDVRVEVVDFAEAITAQL